MTMRPISIRRTHGLRGVAWLLALGVALGGCGSSKPAVPPIDPGTQLAAAEDQARALVRAGTRAELGTSADSVFAAIDADRAQLLADPRGQPLARMFRLEGARSMLVGAAVGAGTTSLLLLLQPGIGAAPPSYTQHLDHPGGTSDTSMVMTSTQVGAVKSVGVAAKVTFTMAGSGLTIEELMTGNVDITLCPDDQGKVPFTYALHIDSKSVSGGVQMDMSGTGTATVGDDAQLTSWTVTTDATYAAQGSAIPVTGSNAEIRVTRTHDWATKATSNTSLDVVRDTTTASIGKGVINAATSLPGIFENMVLDQAQQHWQKGECVEILVDGAQDSNTVQPSSTTPFTGRVHHKVDGVDLPLPIKAALSGGKSLAPTAATPAPVSYGYVAPDQDGQSATAALETRSRRGVGKKSIGFVTRALSTYSGTISFSGTSSSTGETDSWSGSARVTFVRSSTAGGGSVYLPDPASTSVTFDTFESSTSLEVCSLVAPATGGAGTVQGNLTVLTTGTPSYAFTAAVGPASGTQRCTRRSDGNVTTTPITPGISVTTSSTPGDPGWIPLGDGKLLTGSASWSVTGAVLNTSWSLAAQ